SSLPSFRGALLQTLTFEPFFLFVHFPHRLFFELTKLLQLGFKHCGVVGVHFTRLFPTALKESLTRLCSSSRRMRSCSISISNTRSMSAALFASRDLVPFELERHARRRNFLKGVTIHSEFLISVRPLGAQFLHLDAVHRSSN